MDINRILPNIIKDDNNCWNWTKSCNSAGYGQIMEKRKYWLTHRYSYNIKYGDLGDKDIVRHLCHNTKCCNPEHLVKGSHKDNYNDSLDVHRAASLKRRHTWIVEGKVYGTCRDVVKQTGLSSNSVIRFTKNGVFDYESYKASCKIANVIPRVL